MMKDAPLLQYHPPLLHGKNMVNKTPRIITDMGCFAMGMQSFTMCGWSLLMCAGSIILWGSCPPCSGAPN